jgi:hypothetical protein
MAAASAFGSTRFKLLVIVVPNANPPGKNTVAKDIEGVKR